MYLAALIVVSLLVGGLSLFLAVKFLARFGWFFAWLRGTLGIVFLLLAISVAVFAIDLSRYDELLEEQPIASVRFTKIDEQHYRAEIDYYINQSPQEFEIRGDQWQVDARVIRWTGALAAAGAKPGYKLDRISGRYYSLEDERQRERSVYALHGGGDLIDVWGVLHRYSDYVPGIDAQYGSATFLPMADQATFQLSLSHNGLTAQPVNEIARAAVKRWH